MLSAPFGMIWRWPLDSNH